MDRPLKHPRNTPALRLRRHLLTMAAVVALVFGVASIPVVFLYVTKPFEGAAVETLALPELRATAFVGVSVIPMDGERVLPDHTVVVEDGRIAAIGPRAATPVPSDAVRVDGAGKYLLPGLADMHVHLLGDDATNERMLDLLLVNGVTTVLSLRGSPLHLQLGARVAQGELRGPTIFTSGPFISDGTPPPSPDEVERAVMAQARAGYDILKIHGDFTPDGYRRLFETAAREGMRVIGHSPRNLGYEVMSTHGQHAVAHGEEYIYGTDGSSREFAAIVPRIPSLARATAAAGTWVVPNLSAYHGIAAQVGDVHSHLARPEVRWVPETITRTWQPDRNTYVQRFDVSQHAGFLARYQAIEQLTRGFEAAGVRLLAGTDTPIPSVVPGFSLHDELRLLVGAGLTPYQALRAATANAGEFLGGDTFGLIAVGARADVLLLDANPLDAIANTSRIAGVMARGRWLGREELRRILEGERD